MTKTASLRPIYANYAAKPRRPRLVTAGVVLGVLGFLTPIANGAIFEFFWFIIVDPPSSVASYHVGPAFWQLPLIIFFAVTLDTLGPLILLYRAFQGKKWAKWLFITYSVIWRKDYFWSTYTEIASHPNIEGFRKALIEGPNFLFFFQAILVTASIVCLSLPPSNRWFKADPS